MKNLIFISHSTHQDDYCSAWLACKLKDIGYNVWLDLNDLSAGDSFNTVIKPIIQTEAKVFIPITTVSYSEKAENQNSGVSRELNCAVTVDTKQLGHNFILPSKFDGIDYNNFPYHYLGWDSIDFSSNWQGGLITLVIQLEKLNIEKAETKSDPIALWFEAIKAENKPLQKNEKYYSNWFPFELPEFLYIHQPDVFIPMEIFQIPFAFTLDNNRIITFSKQQTIEGFTALRTSFKVSSSKFLNEPEITFADGFTLKDCKNKLVWLLNNTINKHLEKQNLICWKRGKKGKSKVFYFRHPKESSSDYITLKRFNKPKGRRSLTGQINQMVEEKKVLVNWSFGVIPKAELEPFLHYQISYSLVFSDERFKRFEKTLHHKFRRSVPTDWFNRKWFETLLAALLKISPSYESQTIDIEIDKGEFIKVINEPLNSIVNMGYIEPNDDED